MRALLQPHPQQERHFRLDDVVKCFLEGVDVYQEPVSIAHAPPCTHSRYGRRNPNVPIEKLSTGGTAHRSNKLETCKMVPSPPKVTTTSTLAAKSAFSSKRSGMSARKWPHHARIHAFGYPNDVQFVHRGIVFLDKDVHLRVRMADMSTQS